MEGDRSLSVGGTFLLRGDCLNCDSKEFRRLNVIAGGAAPGWLIVWGAGSIGAVLAVV